MSKIKLALVGASGLVGQTIRQVLEEKKLPLEEIVFFASKRSAGTEIEFDGKTYTIQLLDEHSFDQGFDYALFAAGGSVSKKFAPIAIEKGVTVIDNSSAFRMNAQVPLVVPEVNGEDARSHEGLIANPNCSTIQSVVALAPIHRAFGIKRVIYSTYQAVSGSGLAGLEDLDLGLEGKTNDFYPHPIAFNILPHIDDFLEDGYTKEEKKMIDETKKIFHDPQMGVTATTARVPVRFGHSVSINIETERPFEMEELFKVMEEMDGVILIDKPKDKSYPLPLDVEGKDEVYVGRIRRDDSVENGINLWCVADNIRKGAATNTVQIAELIASRL